MFEFHLVSFNLTLNLQRIILDTLGPGGIISLIGTFFFFHPTRQEEHGSLDSF